MDLAESFSFLALKIWQAIWLICQFFLRFRSTSVILCAPHFGYNLESLEVKGMRRLGMSIAVIALVSASTIALGQGFKKISEFLTGYEETRRQFRLPATELQSADQQR